MILHGISSHGNYYKDIYLSQVSSFDLAWTIKEVCFVLQSSNSIDLLIIYIGWMVSEKKMVAITTKTTTTTTATTKATYTKSKTLVMTEALASWTSSHKLAPCHVYWPLVLWQWNRYFSNCEVTSGWSRDQETIWL